MQPQGEVTNVEFKEAIKMLSQAVTNQVGQQRGDRQEGADTSRIREFLRMNPPSFTGSSTTEDLENFIEELKKVFEVMYVVDTERVKLAAYQLKNVARTWFDQWKEGRAENAPPASWACFEEAFLGRFYPRELKEAKVRKFLTIKQYCLSVHDYGFKFTQLSRYAPKMVANMMSRMSLFIARLSRLSSKEGWAAMLIGDMDISRIAKRIGKVAYEFELPQKLTVVHSIFHISMLKKCMCDLSLIIPIENIGIKDSLSYEEIPVQILDRQVRK
ncbi:hypothetical protein MTR67_011707 [Solanum verrucosum]|uniref:Retrotransposon gag domain-containing protein n=1 Tax=Solanum verrucosum TaxID=315347 RepID=A0AAF0TFD0_SOLVR|nr:hypothetical protein MTR67_011707 [Solanum verrucosum]